MRFRFCIAIVICTASASAANSQQVVRFDTSLGSFDMVLNPTNNPLLQGHVDNMLHYVNENAYAGNWINRAAEDFVLQMGGFYSNTKLPPSTIESTRSVLAFTPVEGSPGIEGLSNTVGTVAMALSGLPTGGTNQDSGTSSFFVNLADNTFLDADFTIFAKIADMTVINQIMALSQVDRTDDPDFGADEGNLAFSDVPLLDNGKQVFIKKAFVVTDQMTIARDLALVNADSPTSVADFESSEFSSSSEPLLSTNGGSGGGSTIVPEPTSVAMAAIGVMFATIVLRRRRAR